jgi:hypothetical protein
MPNRMVRVITEPVYATEMLGGNIPLPLGRCGVVEYLRQQGTDFHQARVLFHTLNEKDAEAVAAVCNADPNAAGPFITESTDVAAQDRAPSKRRRRV